jgi:hypothetical protein
MTSPAYLQAIADPDLVGLPLSIYAYLFHYVLDPVQFRPVKQLAIARQFHCDERTVRRAIATLLKHRYLERGAVDVTEARTYRLVHSRMP